MVYDLGLLKRQKTGGNLSRATGGNITGTFSTGTYTYAYHVFTSSGVLTFFDMRGTVDVLVVGAGGGATAYSGSPSSKFYTVNGGGGGGGVVYLASKILTATTYVVTIGAGVPGLNGGDTTAFGVTAYGGGAGADGLNYNFGFSGGSGGGGADNQTNQGYTGGGATQPSSSFGGYGNSGGTAPSGSGFYRTPGGGGGGAGAAANASSGGIGIKFNMTGIVTYYAGGGGGGGNPLYSSGGVPGLGGGGGGSGLGDPVLNAGAPGVNGLGGGAGGATQSGTDRLNKGGDGVVIVRYIVSNPIRDPYFPNTNIAVNSLISNPTYIDDASSYSLILNNNNYPTPSKFNPFSSSYGIIFNGTTDYIRIPSTPALSLTDFTIEGWVYVVGNTGTNRTIFSTRPINSTVGVYTGGSFGVNQNGGLYWYTGSFAANNTNDLGLSNSWNHVAVSRQSNTVSIFLNGNRIPTTADTAVSTSVPIDYLIVGGGGGGTNGVGGGHAGGGGGAGGFRTGSTNLVPAVLYTITVGSGGTAGAQTVAGSGGASSIVGTGTSIISAGGGGGGANQSGLPGGSGGGGDSPGQGGGAGNTPPTVPSQGNDGNNGGGGAGAPGGAGTGGAGGDGAVSNITVSVISTSSIAIGTGSKVFTVASGLSYSAGQPLRIYYDAVDYMYGTISSYSGTTLTVNVTTVVGSGTYSSWTIDYMYAGGGAGGGGAGPLGGAGGGGAAFNGAGANGFGGGGGGTDTSHGGNGGVGGSGVVIIRYPNNLPDLTLNSGTPAIANTGGYKIYTFTGSGAITVNTLATSIVTLNYMLVAGGGSGGSGDNTAGGGGGGGAGGVVIGSVNLATGTNYAVIVGAGGAAIGNNTGLNGNTGTNSTFAGAIAYGGGGGNTASGTLTAANNGGSGGGQGGRQGGGGGSAVAGQGFAGGAGASTSAGGAGGGGGAGGLGGNASNGTTTAGVGGIGIYSSISGSVVGYAGGGSGGGGNSSAATIASVGYGGGASNAAASPFTGGGGGGNTVANAAGSGAGGSGVVIITLASSNPDLTIVSGSIPAVTTSTDTKIYRFTASSVISVVSNPTSFVPLQYLVVGGGGGGGTAGTGGGGGGGSGGLLTSTVALSMLYGTTYAVTVGAGGTAIGNGTGTGTNSSITGSSIASVFAYGGGGGKPAGTSGSGGFRAINGLGGGGGGGGGFFGGDGGGGAGAAGSSGGTVPGGAGGIGVTTNFITTSLATSLNVGDVSSNLVYFAGGGRGGDAGGAARAGSLGGGGAALGGAGGGGAGKAYTGGGGAAGAGGSGSSTPGKGGSGVVILSHTNAYPVASVTGGVTILGVGSNIFYTFTASGTLFFTSNNTIPIPSIDYLVVAAGGGGAGGGNNAWPMFSGGGGGGGGITSGTVYPLYTTTFTVTVGTGGTGGAANSPGASGGNSSIATISGLLNTTAIGGGGGGSGPRTAQLGGSGGGQSGIITSFISTALNISNFFTVTIGNGGAGGTGAVSGTTGSNTVVTYNAQTIIAYGGGGGPYQTAASTGGTYGGTGGGGVSSGVNGGYAPVTVGDKGGTGGGAVGGANSAASTSAGSAGAQSVDYLNLFTSLTALGVSTTGIGAGSIAGSGATININNGGNATGFGCGGGGAGYYGGNGGNGFYGGGGGGAGGSSLVHTGGTGGNGVVVVNFVGSSSPYQIITSSGTFSVPADATSITIWAVGGGGGGAGTPASDTSSGTGGGAGGLAYLTNTIKIVNTLTSAGVAGLSIVGQGNNGSIGTGVYGQINATGGGGGGASTAGTAAAGGDGLISTISGSSVTYSAGGQGGVNTDGTGTSATINTGGGGNGAGNLAGATGGNGGDGVVIIRYVTGVISGFGGTIYNYGTYTVHVFTTTDVFSISSLALPQNFDNLSLTAASIGANYDGSEKFSGYISNLRVTRNQSIFSNTTSFIVSSVPLTTSTVGHLGAGAATTITGAVSMLTAKSNNFIDLSYNSTLTAVSTSVAVTIVQPFINTPSLNGSIYFDGNLDWVQTASSSTQLSFGSNDFTIEAWVYQVSKASTNLYPTIICNYPNFFTTATTNIWGLWLDYQAAGANRFYFTSTNGPLRMTGTTFISKGTWNHVALVRTASTLTMYVNGSLDTSTSIAVSIDAGISVPNYLFMGGNTGTGGTQGQGSANIYLNNVRVVNGLGVYTNSFPVPNRPLTTNFLSTVSSISTLTASQTVLLTGQTSVPVSNTMFYDYSPLNLIVKRGAGAPYQGSFSPYGTNWGTYFNGTTDYISSANTNYLIGTGDFTIEAWIFYSTNLLGGNHVIVSTRPTSSTAGVYTGGALGINSSNQLYWYTGENIIISAPLTQTSTVPYTSILNSWCHVAVVRYNTTINLYLNGNSLPNYSPTPTFNYLVVAGGGGGGSDYSSSGYAAGGGGGGFLTGVTTSNQVTTTFVITVGAGGTGGISTPGSGPVDGSGSYGGTRGGTGTNSVFGTVVTYGGGGGSASNYTRTPSPFGGGNGGSGGGGGGYNSGNGGSQSPGVGVYPGSTYISAPIQGYDGGYGTPGIPGGAGGGGGAGSSPTNQTYYSPNTYGGGGVGTYTTLITITTTTSIGQYNTSTNSLWFSGGGGGAGSISGLNSSAFPSAYAVNGASIGGMGGGGASGQTQNGSSLANGISGSINSGGGGGGGAATNDLGTPGTGGNGGSGVVVLSYLAGLGTTQGNGTTSTTGTTTLNVFTVSSVFTYTNNVTGFLHINDNLSLYTVTIGANNNGSEKFIGFISNVRMVIGTAVYTSNFTPSVAQLAAIPGTQLLTLQNNRFVDNSNNNSTFTITGTPSIQRFSPFTSPGPYNRSIIGGSTYFTSSNLLMPYTYNHHLPGDFTIEFWMYWISGTGMLINKGGGTGIANASYEIYIDSTTKYVRFAASTSNAGYEIGGENTNGNLGAISAYTWNHVAVTRSGSTFRGFVNGVQGFTQVTSTATLYDSTPRGLAIGSNYVTTWGGTLATPFIGYISDLRIIKGQAIYTTNFTPSTIPLNPTANTVLSLPMSDAPIVDQSGRNNINTSIGATVPRLSYTTTSSLYNPNGSGALMYFPGASSVSMLSTPINAFGYDSFTVEAWFNRNVTGVIHPIVSSADGSDNNNYFIISVETTNLLTVTLKDTATSSTAFITTGTTVINTGTWYHVAMVRSANSVTTFLNGNVEIAAFSNGYSLNQHNIIVGASLVTGSLAYFTGFIDNVRVTKGLARYLTTGTTSSFGFNAFQPVTLLPPSC
jgi:hypothetical protein